MEVLKALSDAEISHLRDVFEVQAAGLDVRAFESVLLDACRSKPSVNVANLRLRELFSEIDVSGDGYVNWDEFTSYIIHKTDGKHKTASGTGLDGIVKNYLLSYVIEDEIPKSIVQMQYIERLNKIVKVTRSNEHARIRVCMNDNKISPSFDIPRPPGGTAAVALTYIPTCAAQASNCLAVSYNDSYLRLYDMQKRRLTMDNEVRTVKSLRLLETQTSMCWSSKFTRLVMGSRTGIISVLHPDEQEAYHQEKLHSLIVSDMAIDDSLLFTASLDPENPVKCIDLQRGVVRYALNDHAQGACIIGVNAFFQSLFSVGFELHVVSHAMLMPRVKPWKLFDSHRPHRGRITQMQVVPNTPQLISSDSCGLTKLWDIRMNQCVQNILPPKDELDITPPEQSAASSMCIVPSSKRVILNGRSTAIYCYEGAQDPSVADDAPANIILVNISTQMFVTIHQRTIKHWEIASGELTATYKDVMADDITAAALVLPMERKLILGSATGRVIKVSAAMCEFERDLSQFIPGNASADHHRMGGGGSPFHNSISGNNNNMSGTGGGTSKAAAVEDEVVALFPLEPLRDAPNPLVLAVFRRALFLLPDVDSHALRSATPLRCISDRLGPTTTVKSAKVVRNSLAVIGSSDGVVRAADLTTLALVSTFRCKEVMRGDVIAIAAVALTGTSSGMVVFCAMGCGVVSVGVTPVTGQWDLVSHWDATEHCEVKVQPASGSNSLLPDEEIAATISLAATQGRLLRVAQGGLGRSGRSRSPSDSRNRGESARTGAGTLRSSAGSKRIPRGVSPDESRGDLDADDGGSSSSGDEAGAAAGLSGHGLPRIDSAVAAYLNATTTAERAVLLGSVVVSLQLLSSHDILATGDEKGVLTLWDVRPCIHHAGLFVSEPHTAPLAHFPPAVIRWWRAHDDEITALTIFCEKEKQRIVVVTASNDKSVRIWSADGILLGNLALGRDESGTLVRGVEPYRLASQTESSNNELWRETNEWLEGRFVPPPSTSSLAQSHQDSRGTTAGAPFGYPTSSLAAHNTTPAPPASRGLGKGGVSRFRRGGDGISADQADDIDSNMPSLIVRQTPTPPPAKQSLTSALATPPPRGDAAADPFSFLEGGNFFLTSTGAGRPLPGDSLAAARGGGNEVPTEGRLSVAYSMGVITNGEEFDASSRTFGLLKPQAVLRSQIKRYDRNVQLTAHTGILPQSQKQSPRRRTSLLPMAEPGSNPSARVSANEATAKAPGGGGVPGHRYSRAGTQVIVGAIPLPAQQQQQASGRLPSPSRSPRYVTERPPAMRIVESRESKRVVEMCRQRIGETKLQEDVLNRDGRIVLGSLESGACSTPHDLLQRQPATQGSGEPSSRLLKSRLMSSATGSPGSTELA